jgi:hypothetical protein
MHVPIRDDRNTFPARRTALFLSGLGSLLSETSYQGVNKGVYSTMTTAYGYG